MNGDDVTRLLKTHQSYRYAVNNGIAPWDRYDNTGMPLNGEFGSRIPPRWTGSGDTTFSEWDYRRYKHVVDALDGAINTVLSDNQRMVIMRKYIDRNKTTLYQIAIDRNVDESTVRRWHKEALKTLADSLVLTELPEIHDLTDFLEKVGEKRKMHG